jgi:hypothetical protein
MAASRDKPAVLSAHAKALPELQTAIYAADGDILDIDFAQIRHRWLTRLSRAERRAIQEYEKATPIELGSIAPDALAFLRRLGCRIDQNESLRA